MKLITKNDKLYIYDSSKDKYYLLSEDDLDYVIDDSEMDSDGKPKLLSDEQVRRYLEDKYGPKKKTKEQQQGFYSKKANLKEEYANVTNKMTDNAFIQAVFEKLHELGQDISELDRLRLIKNPTIATIKSLSIPQTVRDELSTLYAQYKNQKILTSAKDEDENLLSLYPNLIEAYIKGDQDIFENVLNMSYVALLQDIQNWYMRHGRNPQSQEAIRRWSEIQRNIQNLLQSIRLAPRQTPALNDLRQQIQAVVNQYHGYAEDLYANARPVSENDVPSMDNEIHSEDNNVPVLNVGRRNRRGSLDRHYDDNGLFNLDYPAHSNSESKKESYERDKENSLKDKSSESVDIIENKDDNEINEVPIPIPIPLEIKPIEPNEIKPIDNKEYEQLQKDIRELDKSDLMINPEKIGFQKAYRFMKWIENQPKYLDPSEFEINNIDKNSTEYVISIGDGNKIFYKVHITGGNTDTTFNELMDPIENHMKNNTKIIDMQNNIRSLPSKLIKNKEDGSSIKFNIEPVENLDMDENVQMFIDAHEELFDPKTTTLEQFTQYLDGLKPNTYQAKLPHYPKKGLKRTPLYPNTMTDSRQNWTERTYPKNDKEILLSTLINGLVTMTPEEIAKSRERTFFGTSNKELLESLLTTFKEGYKYKNILALYKSGDQDFKQRVDQIIDQFMNNQYKVYGYPGDQKAPISKAHDITEFTPNAVQDDIYYDYMYQNTENMFSKGKLSKVLMHRLNKMPLNQRPYSGIKPDGHDLSKILKIAINTRD